MRQNARRQQTKTRSIQSSVQVLLLVSGIAFLLAGLVLAASGASVDSAIGSVDDRWDDSQESTDSESADDTTPVDDGNETDSDDGDSTDGGDGGNGDGGDGGNGDGGDGGNGDGDGGDGGDGDNGGDDERQTLTVIVEDQDGDPIDGADVSHDPFSDNKTTGGNGEAEWDVEDGSYHVSAAADGYQSAEDDVQIDGSDETVTLTLEDDDGNDDDDETYELAVSVVDENDSAIDNATVTVDGGLFDEVEQDVDDDGEAVFEDLEPQEYTVTADADGYESETNTVEIEDSDESITLELQTESNDDDDGGVFPFVTTP